jgi:hypothetical protein
VCFAIDGDYVVLLKICSKDLCVLIILVKVYKGWSIFYIVTTTLHLTMMNSNPFRGGYKVIMHKSTQNGSQTITHIQVDTCNVLLVTQVAFAHVLQLVKTKSKNKFFNLLNFAQGVSFMNSIWHYSWVWQIMAEA